MEAKSAFAITPHDMYEKMLEEYEDFKQDSSSIRHAINFTLTAYHLREWVWKSYLKSNSKLRSKISKDIKTAHDFYEHMNSECEELKIVKELANNVKHFYAQKGAGSKVERTTGPITWENADVKWEDLHIEWGYGGLVIITKDKKGISVLNVFKSVRNLWEKYFNEFFT